MNFNSEINTDDPGIDFENYSLEEEIAKYDGVTPQGYQILVRLFVPKKVTKIGSILLPESQIEKLNEDAKFTNLTGLVIKFARGVYKDEELYKHTKEYCKVGDWIQFARASGHSFTHNNMSSIYITEHKIFGTVKDPRTISRIKA